jgi:hypothetical protein
MLFCKTCPIAHYEQNPYQPYCQFVVTPKVAKVGERLK